VEEEEKKGEEEEEEEERVEGFIFRTVISGCHMMLWI
jgi:hypothetical protein